MSKLNVVRSHQIVTFLLGALSLLAIITYFLLDVLSQHTYGLLHVSPAAVGLDRTRLIEESVGLYALIVAYAGAFGLLAALLARLTGLPMLRTCAGGIAVALIGLLWAGWNGGTTMADSVRAGRSVAGQSLGGLRMLDFDATPMRFVRIPKDHAFDRGCMLFLGRGAGQLVVYDTRAGQARHLPDEDYRAEVLDPSVGLPDRCHTNHQVPYGSSYDPVARAAEIETVDVIPGVLVWAQHRAGTPGWELLARRGARVRLLGLSDRRMQPDLGRDTAGRLVVTYRTCRATRCRVMTTSPAAEHPGRPYPTPGLAGCAPAWPARNRWLVSVVLTGPGCPAARRGLWIRSGEVTRWRRVVGPGATFEDIDALDSRVAWVERRGPILGLREWTGGRVTTLFEDTLALGHIPSAMGSVQLTVKGVRWMDQHEDMVSLMHRLKHSRACVEDEMRGVFRRDDAPRIAWLNEGDKYLAYRGRLEHLTEQAYNDTVIGVERERDHEESAAARRCLP